MNEFDPLERIRQLCAERSWSYYQLAKASGITYSTLSTMINKHNMPSFPTLQKLCDGFGITLSEFFEPDRNLDGLTQEQAQCLTLFTRLAREERQLALTYMKGLARQL